MSNSDSSTPTPAEEWRPVAGYEGFYEVSDQGRVRSLPVGGHYLGTFLRPYAMPNGYLQVHLCADGKRKKHYVHRIVGKAFLPNPEGRPQVNHRDGCRANNAVANLEWATVSENNLHAFRELGRQVPWLGKPGPWLGKQAHNRKLTPVEIRAIRADVRPNKAVGAEYGIHDSTVSLIKRRLRYRDIE